MNEKKPKTSVVNKTPIKKDPATGFRYTHRDVGVIKNSPPDRMKELKVFLDPSPHVVLDQSVQLQGWYKSKREAPGRRSRGCHTEALLAKPYGGRCPVSCTYCYINNGVRGYQGQGISVVDPKYPEKFRRQVSRLKTAAHIYLSPFTDPFNPLEDHYHNTQGVMEACAEFNLPMLVTTRRPVPEWAWPLLRKNPHSYIHFSLNTPDAEAWAQLSPGAASLAEILEQVKKAKKLGIYVGMQINPIVPGLTSTAEIVKLIKMVKKAGASHCIFKFVELVYPAVKPFRAVLAARFGEKVAAGFDAVMTDNSSGVKTAAEEYRREALAIFKKTCDEVGVTMALCHEFENVDGGASIPMSGFQSAESCHGKSVPMYTRDSTAQAFRALTSCPPSGCLKCEESAGAGKPPCGSALLQQATALKLSDYAKMGTLTEVSPKVKKK